MRKEDEKLDNLFNNQWDIYNLENNHKEKFLNRLQNKKNSKKNYFIPFAIAASLLILISIIFLFNKPEKSNELKFASKETKQTDSIFTVMIERELIKIKEKKSPENEKIIVDALKQMKMLDADYENIKHELLTTGENKQIINAMITNLQTRINFLQSVLQHIESSEKLKSITDEKTI